MTRDGRLLLAPQLTRALLAPRNVLIDLPQQVRVPPRRFVQAAAMRIREDQEISTLAVHRFE